MVAEHQVTGYERGPDLYEYFLGERNRAYLFHDPYHPNGLGNDVVAALWRNALLQQDLPLPYIPENFSVYMPNNTRPLYPHQYQLNYLEIGDRPYVDTDVKITSLPRQLVNAVWAQSVNAHKNFSHDQYLTLNLGRTRHTLYVAYPTEGTLPSWLERDWQLSQEHISLSGGYNKLKIFTKQDASGVQVFGGATSPAVTATRPATNYLIAISPPG